jgi:hypothetical protein
MLLSEARRVVAVVAAFAAGVTLAWVPFSSEPLPFRETSRYPVWVFLIAIACASCPIVWSHGTSALAQLPAHRPPMLEALAYGAWTIALTVGLLVVPAALPSRGSPPVPLPNLGLRLAVVYLAVILDAYSRKVIGWHLDRTLETSLTLAALRMARLELGWNGSPAAGSAPDPRT